MVYSWQDGQLREKMLHGWTYQHDRGDTASHCPSAPEWRIVFAKKTMGWFGRTMDACDGSMPADIGCGPCGTIAGPPSPVTDNGTLAARIPGAVPSMDTYREYGILKCWSRPFLSVADANHPHHHHLEQRVYRV